MWAGATVPLLPPVTIHAQKLEVARESILDDPCVEEISSPWMGRRFPLHSSIVVSVVDSQEEARCFTTAGAAIPVGAMNPCESVSSALKTCGSLVAAQITPIPTPSIRLMVEWKLVKCLCRATLPTDAQAEVILYPPLARWVLGESGACCVETHLADMVYLRLILALARVLIARLCLTALTASDDLPLLPHEPSLQIALAITRSGVPAIHVVHCAYYYAHGPCPANSAGANQLANPTLDWLRSEYATLCWLILPVSWIICRC